MDDLGNLSDGIFSMTIDTSFKSTNPPSDPSLTQLAFNLDPFPVGSFSFTSAITPPGSSCTPNSPGTTTTCDGTITLGFGSNNSQGVDGSGQKFGYDLLVNLPPPGIKLNNAQSPITLYIQGPSDFKVASFRACSFDKTYAKIDESNCPEGYYETVAKIRELNAPVGSTVLIGFDPPNGNGTSVPAPLPLAGAAAALGLSRSLRRRLAARPVEVVGTR